MSELSHIDINNVPYEIKDAYTRQALSRIEQSVSAEQQARQTTSIVGCYLDGTNKRLNFTNASGNVVAYVSTATFLKDGMVSDVKVVGNYLLVSFNDDANKQPIQIPISDIFNSANYYTKTEVNSAISEEHAQFVAASVYAAAYNSSTRRIEFKNQNNEILFDVDATPFIKDGMVSDVSIVNGNLVITFNTDSGKSPISIPLTSIFNPSNYYQKSEIDSKLAEKQSEISNLESKIGYYECSSEASSASKTIAASNYVLGNGGSIKIKMQYANTAVSGVTLRIGTAEPKPLYYEGAEVSANNTWDAGETVEIYYDGTSYYANNVAGGSGSGDGAFDVSAKYPTSGVEGGNTYTLEGALAVLNANLSASKKKGGMSIKFIRSSDNKYVQYRYMVTDVSTAATFTNVANWQGVDEEPEIGSHNLVESGGVAYTIQPIIGTPKTDYEWEQTNGYYPVNLNTQIGSELPSVTIAVNNGCTAKIPCKHGDKFVIHSRLSLACAYFFLDVDNKILFIPTDSLGTKYKDANHNTEIIAPANSAFVIVQSNLNEWRSSEFGGDGTTGIYPYREATSGIVGQVEQNTSDIESIETQLGNHSEGMVKDIDDLLASDELQNTKINALEDSLEDVSERIDEVTKDYDKSKSYIVIEISTGQLDFRNFYNNTNIKNEQAGTCTIDWGDGTPVVSVVNDDSFKHSYAQAGTYTIIINGLKSINSDNFLRELSYIRDVLFANTLTSISSWVLNGTTLNYVTFFGSCPALSGSAKSVNSFNKVQRIVVPESNLMQFVNNFYDPYNTTNPDAISKKIEPDEEVSYIYRNVEVTVGQDGDYLTIEDALQYLSKFYPLYKYGGIKVVIKILSGTVISEQIYVDGVDYSWITIEYEDYNPDALNFDNVASDIANGVIVFDTTTGYNSVSVDASAWTGTSHDTRGDVCLFRAENGGKLPIIHCVFKLVTPNASYGACGVVCNRGSEAVIKTLCGFIGFQDGVIANNESSITIREGITMNCSRWGCHARHNGEVSARSVIATGCATNTTYASEYGAAVADRVADMDIREAYLSGNVAIRCNNASTICARATHVLGGGVANAYMVQATYSGRINASNMTFTNLVTDAKMFSVANGGWMDAFSVTDKTYNVSTLNTIDINGIIFG